jgi:hypothetical protein
LKREFVFRVCHRKNAILLKRPTLWSGARLIGGDGFAELRLQRHEAEADELAGAAKEGRAFRFLRKRFNFEQIVTGDD